MDYNLSKDNKAWVDSVFEKLKIKLAAECARIGDKIPCVAEDGVYKEDKAITDIFWWTNGFWPGMLWQMYHATGDEAYRQTAEAVEKKLITTFDGYEDLHHDVGFMFLHTTVANYKLTGNAKSRTDSRHAANILAGRYNPLGKFIRAWNDWTPGESMAGWVIIDCMMNIPLLYWASEDLCDPRYKAIAIEHADTMLEKLMRSDGRDRKSVV